MRVHLRTRYFAQCTHTVIHVRFAWRQCAYTEGKRVINAMGYMLINVSPMCKIDPFHLARWWRYGL